MSRQSEAYIESRVAVPAAYEEIFSHFYFAENKSATAINKTLLPSYQTIMVFSFGNKVLLHSGKETEIAIDKCMVIGPIKTAFDYSLPPQSQLLVANFKDDAFYRFFGDASVIESIPIDPDSLLNENCFANLWTALNRMADAESRVQYLLEFCQPYLKQRNIIAAKLASEKEQHLSTIRTVAAKQNQTERNVQIIQKKQFGYSDKERSRYLRFLHAIEKIQELASGNSKIDWFEIIHECGYYDQSQLIHDFKHFLHLTPTHYLKFQQDICNPITT